MRDRAQLGAFDLLVVTAAGALGLLGGWFIGSYAALALGGLVSLLTGASDWLHTVGMLGGIAGAAAGTGLGVVKSVRALRSSRVAHHG